MHDWGYITLAYGVVWGALALYAVVLARRVYQAREFARNLQRTLSEEHESE